MEVLSFYMTLSLIPKIINVITDEGGFLIPLNLLFTLSVWRIVSFEILRVHLTNRSRGYRPIMTVPVIADLYMVAP